MTTPQTHAGTAIENSSSIPQKSWPLWRKIIFRFFFVYLCLEIAPWQWISDLPYSDPILKPFSVVMDWAVNLANAKLFHIRPVLIPIAGSGDTSYGWAQECLFILLAAGSCIIWSILDRKRKNYQELNYWLCLFTRYNIAAIAFGYGSIKIFGLQMGFPEQSMLATPLGDLLPMRFSWLFIGYSSTYQFFGGILETMAGLLLLFRRTSTLGILLATGVFTNVLLLNLCYDIPVKIFSANIVIMCLFLLANEAQRLACIFVWNKPASVCSIYSFPYSKKWLRRSRVILKTVFLVVVVGLTFYVNARSFISNSSPSKKSLIKSGYYDVAVFARNKDTISPSNIDTLRWKDVVFEESGLWGSIGTSDTSFRQWYRRGYFLFKLDTNQQTISFRKLQTDSRAYDGIIMSMKYKLPDSSSI